ncbi:hypothetical protein [Amycolatopsis sp. CA-128772]|uniref:hypothetical protein n=1 Tax=Amycolatopsis sp. CA-128772 TaxID=2073159 RepID=UPI0011B0B077|nr:hypothetical protein [Amycolatopsis sp. CA-128772]
MSYRSRHQCPAEAEAPTAGGDADVVQGGRPAARGNGADFGAVEVEFDPAGRPSRGRRTGDQDEADARRPAGRVLERDIEVRPLGEAPGRELAAFLRAADLAELAVQPVAVAVRLELVVEVQVEPVTTQADDEISGRGPARNQPAELAARPGPNGAARLTDDRLSRDGPDSRVDRKRVADAQFLREAVELAALETCHRRCRRPNLGPQQRPGIDLEGFFAGGVRGNAQGRSSKTWNSSGTGRRSCSTPARRRSPTRRNVVVWE